MDASHQFAYKLGELAAFTKAEQEKREAWMILQGPDMGWTHEDEILKAVREAMAVLAKGA